MKILGKPILGGQIQFTYEVDGNEVTAADAKRIKKVDCAVCNSPAAGNTTSLSDLVNLLTPLVESEGEVKVSLEPIYDY